MTTLPLDVLLLILDCVYLDQSPVERQRTLAAVALTSRSLNAFATSLLYATPQLSTTRSARKYGRLFSYHVSPWGVMGGRARWPKTITPNELVVSQEERLAPCPCDDSSHLCRHRCLDCSTIHSPLPNLLFAAMSLFESLTSIMITDCYFDSEPLARMLEEGAPLRRRIERLELVDACGSDEALAWIFRMYRNDNARTLDDEWEESFREDEGLRQWLSDTHDVVLFDPKDHIAQGAAEASILERMKYDYELWRLFHSISEDLVSYEQRWSDPFSSTLAFPNLRRLSIPAFHEYLMIVALFARGLFPNLKHLAINRDPRYGDCELQVDALDLRTMRRSITRPYLDALTPGRDGYILPSRLPPDPDIFNLPVVEEDAWVPLSYEELEEFQSESPVYRGPELDVLDLERVVVVFDDHD